MSVVAVDFSPYFGKLIWHEAFVTWRHNAAHERWTVGQSVQRLVSKQIFIGYKINIIINEIIVAMETKEDDE